MFAAIRLTLGFLSPKERLVIAFLVAGRLLANLLDVVAVLAVGFIGAALAEGLSGNQGASFLGVSVPPITTEFLTNLSLLVAAFFLAKSALAAALVRVSVTFLASIEAHLATKIVRYLFSGPLARIKKFSEGEILWLTSNSIQQAVTGLLGSAMALLAETGLFVGMFVVFLLVNTQVALMITVYFLCLMLLFQLVVNRRIRSLGLATANSSIAVANSAGNMLRVFREMKVLGATERFIQRFASQRHENARVTAIQTFLLSLPRYFVESALMVGVLILAARQLTSGDLADGIVTTSVFLAGGVKMMAALLPLQNSYSNLRFYAPQAFGAQEVLSQAENSPERSLPAMSDSQRTGLEVAGGLAVSLKRVFYTHPGESEAVISDVSLEIPGGSYVALVGPSGAGKSTLVDILLGVNPQSSGSVSIGGVPPELISSNYPGLVAYVPQNPGLVSGTIAQNVALGSPAEKIDEEQVLRCIDSADLGEFVRSLTNGVNEDLGPQAQGLSGGQKQRLGLARALYTNPKLIVLDEATSALDAEAEANVADTLRGLAGHTTLIVIAHRLSTIQHADNIFVLEKGKLLAEGSFASVRRKVPMIEDYIRLMSFGPD